MLCEKTCFFQNRNSKILILNKLKSLKSALSLLNKILLSKLAFIEFKNLTSKYLAKKRK